MSHWSTRLPYAHRYLGKTWFYGSEKELIVAEFLKLDRERHPHLVLSQDLKTVILTPSRHEYPPEHGWGHAEITSPRMQNMTFYFEAQFCSTETAKSSLNHGTVGFGFEWPRIIYYDNGDVWVNWNLEFRVNAYRSGDVIGLGYIFPTRCFITKNGKFIHVFDVGTTQERGVCPMIHFLYSNHLPGTSIRANFGQMPFACSALEEYLNSYLKRSRELAASLPMEILGICVRFALSPTHTNTIGSATQALVGQDYALLQRISGVCRWWRALCSRAVLETISLSTPHEFEHVLAFHKTVAPLRFHTWMIYESPKAAWTHKLFVSPIIPATGPATISISLTAPVSQQPRPKFMSKMHPTAIQRLPGIFRGFLTELRTLELSHYSFPTWIRFAQLISALRHLKHLRCIDVTWDSCPDVPPHWLASSNSLKDVYMGSQAWDERRPERRRLALGCLWLFLSARPRPPSQRSEFDKLTLDPLDAAKIAKLMAIFIERTKDFCKISFAEEEGKPGYSALTCRHEFKTNNRTRFNGTFSNTTEEVVQRFVFRRKQDPCDGTSQLLRIEQPFIAWLEWIGPAEGRVLAPTALDQLKEIEKLRSALSSADICCCRFDTSGIYGLTPQCLEVAKAMGRQPFDGLLEFIYRGELERWEDAGDHVRTQQIQQATPP